MEILVVDLGNYNIKTSKGVIFNSKMTTKPQLLLGDEYIIGIDGKEYVIDSGNFDKEFNKVQKNYLPLLLAATVKSTKKSEIALVLNSPIVQMNLAKEYSNNLLDKELKFTVNGKSRKVTFKRVEVVAEAFSAYYSLPKEVRHSKDRVLIIDIGGRTTNVASFINGKRDKVKTIPKGVMDFYETIANRENATGKKYTIEEMESLINYNKVSNIEDERLEFMFGVVNDIKFSFDTMDYELFFCGGGSEVFKDIIEKKITRGQIMDSPLMSNVQGSYFLAKERWSDLDE